MDVVGDGAANRVSMFANAKTQSIDTAIRTSASAFRSAGPQPFAGARWAYGHADDRRARSVFPLTTVRRNALDQVEGVAQCPASHPLGLFRTARLLPSRCVNLWKVSIPR